MEEINGRQSSEITHISAVPQLLWSQLYHGLTPFLEMRRGPGDALVLCWSHRCLKECASSRYLGSEEALHARFHMLADYFSGKLAEVMMEEESLKGTPTSDSGMHVCTSSLFDKGALISWWYAVSHFFIKRDLVHHYPKSTTLTINHCS